MALNPSIILAGQTPDILGSMSRGASTADQLNQIKRGNALQNLYRSQGDQIAAGNENALAQLARFDPNAALGVQQTRQTMDAQRLNMDATRQTMARLDREERRQIEAAAAQMDAQQAQDAAAKMDAAVRELATYHQQGNRQAYMQAVQRLGLDPSAPEYQFDNFPALAARSGETIEILSTTRDALGIGSNEPQFRPATAEEAALYGAQAGQIDTETGRFYPNNPSSGMTVESTPDGGFRFVQGPGVGQERPAEADPTSPTAMISTIDGILQDPDLAQAVGPRGAINRRLGPLAPNAARVDSRLSQLEGQSFLQAFESLKGGGQITEIEGQKATQAIARLSRDQSVDDFRAALEELRSVLVLAQSRPPGWASSAEGQAALTQQPEAQIPPAPTNVPGITPDNWPQVWEAMPPEDRELFK